MTGEALQEGQASRRRPMTQSRWSLDVRLACAWTHLSLRRGAYADSAGNFNIGVTVGGQFVSDTPVASGGSLDLAIRAGQSATFDAGEPAIWTMYVGGAAVNGGAQVYYAGVDITATTLSRSSVAVDTYAPFLLQSPFRVTLVATSTYDSARVATVNLLITN